MSDSDLIRRGDVRELLQQCGLMGTHQSDPLAVMFNEITAVQPSVKPLVWRSNGKGHVCADTPFGLYEVEHGRYGMRLLHGGSFMQDDLQGIEAAKAAAQADYEARILSVLDMQPTVSHELLATTNDVAVLVDALEQAKDFIDDQYACAESQAIQGEYVAKEARQLWYMLCAALARVKGETK